MSAAHLYCAFEGDAEPTVDFLRWVVGSFELNEPLRALDVGCGTGRLLQPLGALGWHVVGLEPDPDYRSFATSRTTLSNVEVREGQFNTISEKTRSDPRYDLIFGMNSSFSHVVGAEERADALAQCRSTLRDGGVLLLDLPNFVRILYEYGGTGKHQSEHEGRIIHLERRHEIDVHAATFTTHEVYTVREPDDREWTFHKDHCYAITTLPELTYTLKRAGFRDIRTYTSLSARASERLGKGRMILAARAS